MSKILVYQGAPGVGKSSAARKFVKENPHWIIVCRDSIRQSLGDYWVSEREDLVSKIELYNIKTAIEMGWNVIIDATNLNPKTIAKWEALADEMQCEIEYKEFWIPFHLAVERDQNPDRDHKVGYKVIYDFYKKYKPELLDEKNWDNRYIKQGDPTKPKAIIVDVDGTIALRQGRSPYDYEKCDTDKPETRVLAIIDCLYRQGVKVLFVSGREKIGNCEEKTRSWISKQFDGKYELFMRNEGDHRPDPIVKEEIYHSSIEPEYNVISVFDDRDRVVDMWRNIGLLVCQVYYGNF